MTRSDDSRHAPVAIIDWNTGGHHLTYLREYVLAFAERDIPTVVMSPQPPAIDPFPPSAVWMEIPTISWIRERKSTGTALARWRYARHLAAVMRKAEKSLGSRCARALLGCLYENQAKIASRVITTLDLPCAGLYLQAGVFHSGEHLGDGKLARNTRNLLRHGLLERVFMLDGEMADTVSDLSGKPVVLLPDVTDCSIVEDHPLPAQLGIPVGKRPVIGLLGHLRPGKGVTDLIAFARSEPALDACFLLAGSCDWNDFSADEKQDVLTACADDARIIFHPERIPDEAGYNALVKSCDVLWAVYRDAPHSSNTLTKAACFERPVVVAEGHMMARQTRDYHLGEVVPQGDPASLKEVLPPMLKDPGGWRERNHPRWRDFRTERSNERFRDLLRDGVPSARSL